jgi:hypothetical protein
MSFLQFFSKRKKVSLISIALLAVLLVSGALASSGAFQQPVNYTANQSAHSFASAPPTAEGTVATISNPSGPFLIGPTTVLSPFDPSNSLAASSGSDPPPSAPGHVVPFLNPKQGVAQATKNPSNDPPKPAGCAGCDPIDRSSGGATVNPLALNAVNNFQTFGYTVEPPDQGLCANSQYVMEIVNIGAVQIYSASNLQPVSGVASLDNLMGLTALSWSSAGDISCVFDYSNGGHWFIMEIVSTTTEASGGPFSGCFVAKPDTCREGIAVSTGSNPLTSSWNVYFLDPNKVNCDPGSPCGPAPADGSQILNDYAKQGTTADAFMLFYDEFNLGPLPAYCATGPGYGCAGFNGAQQLAFSLSALENGQGASTIKVAYENMGTASNLYPIPASQYQFNIPASCNTGPLAGFACWYQVIPAITPDPSQFDSSSGGTGWMVGSLDFFGAGDNRVAAFDWTGLCALDTSCANTVQFGGTLYTLPNLIYRDEGLACLVQFGGFCGLGNQQGGPIPLGDNCGQYVPTLTVSCPESGLATNGDGATQASYAHGLLWAAVSTMILQTFGRSSELHLGATYWGIGSSSVQAAGYVTADHEDLEFPSIAATDGGNAVMSFTLSGPDFYPSAAYTTLTSRSNAIHITAEGKSPQDGFTEYLSWPGLTRPRWGDYEQTVFVPSVGPRGQGAVYFAAEYIQSPNCNDQAFTSQQTNGHTFLGTFDAITCGGTRTVQANWGTAISSVPTT